MKALFLEIIRGWVDTTGEMHGEIFDVAWSGNRVPSAGGEVPAVSNTADLATATFANRIGAAQLMGGWTDATFNPEQHALYHLWVIEFPTARWSTWVAMVKGLPLLEDVPTTIQERA